MINVSYLNEFNTPLRQIKSKVELYNGSALLNTFSYNDALKKIVINRESEKGKFFGFGVTHKATVNLVDLDRQIEIVKGNKFDVYFKLNDNEYVNNFPSLYIYDVARDENTNELTITAYDTLLYAAAARKVSDITIPVEGFTLSGLAAIIAEAIGLELDIRDSTLFDFTHTGQPNYEGSETLKEVLDDIAELTATIYYVIGNKLIFRRLDKGAAADLIIEKRHYFTLKSEEQKTLGAISSTTELGNNIIASVTPGLTQYIRDNDFIATMPDDKVGDLIERIGNLFCGITLTPFVCSWRGNYLIEPGDKIEIVTKDNNTITSYILSDTVTYGGGYNHATEWSYEAAANSTANPSTLGEVLKQTYAKVDKANKQIALVASETAANKNNISTLLLDTNSIRASVESLDDKVRNTEEATAESIESLKKQVEATMTDEEVQIAIKTELDNGTKKVVTNTGFTFDDTGLTVSKSGSEITTTITEDGMTVKKDHEEVLQANNEGVKAIDLHAKTFLIIGNNSRFEDYQTTRTACYWIGG